MPELSIILPTCNRGSLLAAALKSISTGVKCDHEIIVVDGASTDHTQDILADAQRRLGKSLRIIREERREGFVKAANKGFRAARGEMMTWLNDDARPAPGALDLAIAQLKKQPDNVALMAMFHPWQSLLNIAYETEQNGKTYRLCHVRGTLYANFCVGLRETYRRLGYFDERFYVCGADPDLSLKAWYAGMSVVPAWGAMIDHDEVADDRRLSDREIAREDNRLLFEKWNLPHRNSYRNDFDPKHPCTLRPLADVLEHAA